MTSAKSGPSNVVVVDGSNIATEGRSMPSLAQLKEAVKAFKEEFPDAVVTVVVDATFGHRIDKKELPEFDAAVANNEIVAPPAGAIGRGDAFVLSIANKVGARILSNDSFQEFHGDYPWLFEEGRLIGGKPVPNVGWVFVERLPVKGAVSRKATRAARQRNGAGSRRTASKEASQPMPVPSAPPPNARLPEKQPAADAKPPRPAAGAPVNDLLPFLEFVEHHPIGSSVNGVVESYSSHGAYVRIGDLRGYVPLRLMADPPPRSAREVMKIGDAVTLVVTNFAPARRSVDLAIPKLAPVTDVQPQPGEAITEAAAPPVKTTRRRGRKRSTAAAETTAAAVTTAAAAPAGDEAVAAQPGAVDVPAATEQAGTPLPSEPAPAAPVAEETTATRMRRGSTRRAAGRRAAATKAATTTTAAVPSDEPAPAPGEPAVTAAAPTEEQPAARKAAAKRPAKQTAAKKTATTKTTAKKATAKKAAATKKTATKKTAAKKAAEPKATAASRTAKKAAASTATSATKAATKKTAAKKTAAKATATKRAAKKAAASARTGAVEEST